MVTDGGQGIAEFDAADPEVKIISGGSDPGLVLHGETGNVRPGDVTIVIGCG